MSAPWYIAGALALGCAGLGLWNWSQSAIIAAKEATIKERDATIVLKDQQIAQAKTTNDENATTITKLRAERDAQADVAAMFDQFARARDARFFSLLERVTHGPADEDGPVPMVLERALDGLREGAAGADRSHKDGSRTGTDPDRQAALSGREASPSAEACGGHDVCLFSGSVPAAP